MLEAAHMKALPTCFEEISNIKRHNDWFDAPTTSFQFKPPGRQAREVKVRSDPLLRDGMRVIAVLHDKDNWTTLVGWKDLETGSIVAKKQEVAIKALALRSLLLTTLLLAIAMGVYPPLLLYPLTLCSFALWESFHEWRFSRKAWQILTEVVGDMSPEQRVDPASGSYLGDAQALAQAASLRHPASARCVAASAPSHTRLTLHASAGLSLNVRP